MSKHKTNANNTFLPFFVNYTQFFIIFTLFLFTALGAWGDAYTWTGGANAAWDNAGNWTNDTTSSGGYPDDINDTAIIEFSGVSTFPVISSAVTIGALTVNNSAMLTIGTGQTLTVSGTVTNNGTIEIQGTGSITKSDSDSGTFIYKNPTSATPMLNSYNNLQIIGTGTATLATNTTVNGTLTVDNSATLIIQSNTLMVSGMVTNNGTITITSTFTASGAVTNAGTITTNGTLTVSGTEAFNNTGGTLNGSGTINLTTTDVVALDGTISTTGAITRTNGTTTISTNIMAESISFAGNVTLGADVEITTTDDITFNSTINGNVTGTESLTLTAGSVALSGEVGGVMPLETLTLIASTASVAGILTVNNLTIGDGTSPAPTTATLSINNKTINETLTVNSGDTLIINSIIVNVSDSSDKKGKVEGTGTITRNSGTLSVNGISVGDEIISTTTTINTTQVMDSLTVNIDVILKISRGVTLTVLGNVTNNGIIEVDTGSPDTDNATFNIGGTLTNTGTISGVEKGVINITSASAVSLAGTISAKGTINRTNGTTTISTSSIISSVVFDKTTVTIGAKLTIGALIVEKGASLTLNSDQGLVVNGNVTFHGDLILGANTKINMDDNFNMNFSTTSTIKNASINNYSIELFGHMNAAATAINSTITLAGAIGASSSKLKHLAVKQANVVIQSTGMLIEDTSLFETEVWLSDVRTLTNNPNSFNDLNVTIDGNNIDTTLNSPVTCGIFTVKQKNARILTFNAGANIHAKTFLVDNNAGVPRIKLEDDITITTVSVNLRKDSMKNASFHITGSPHTLTFDITDAIEDLTFEDSVTLGANITANKAITFQKAVTLPDADNDTITIKTENNNNISFKGEIISGVGVDDRKIVLMTKSDVTLAENVNLAGGDSRLVIQGAKTVNIEKEMIVDSIYLTDITSLTNNGTTFSNVKNFIVDSDGGTSASTTLNSAIMCQVFKVHMGTSDGDTLILTKNISANSFTASEWPTDSGGPKIQIGEIAGAGAVTIMTTGRIAFENNSIIAGSGALTLTANNGKVTLGKVGDGAALKSLTVTATNTGADAITIGANITTEEAILFNSSVTLSSDVTITTTTSSTGTITFKKAIAGGNFLLKINSSSDVSFNGDVGNKGIVFTRIARTLTAGNNLQNVDVYLDHSGTTITLNENLIVRNLYFYNGTLNLGKNITTSEDFVVFGSSYDANDADWPGTNTRHAYFSASLLAYPKPALTNTTFVALNGRTITVGKNFYNNGANMVGTSDWNLVIPNNVPPSTLPVINTGSIVTSDQWGIPYAVAFNMNVAYSQASNGWVAASTVGQGVTNNINNALGINKNWQFGETSTKGLEIKTITIIADNQLEIEFNMVINSTATLLEQTLDFVKFDNGAVEFASVVARTDNNTSPTKTILTYTTGANGWNTDGKVSTNPASTNSAGVEQAKIPVIGPFNKGVFYAANGSIMSQGYVSGTVIDKCPPVLVSIETGRDNGNTTPNTPYNWHNYFQIRYSEPVNIGLAAPVGTLLANVRATENFISATEYGGHLDDNGTDVVTMTGFFTYPGTFKSGSTDGNPVINSIYRGDSPSPSPNEYGYHGIRIYAAGYSDTLKWVGYMSEVTDPNGRLATLIPRDDVKDFAGNSLNIIGTVEIQPTKTGLKKPDWTPPIIGYSNSDSNPKEREVLQRDTNANDFIDKFEIHILDNPDPTWNVDENPEDGGTNTFSIGKGLRDSSFLSGSNNNYGFKIGVTETPNELLNFTFDTNVFDLVYIDNSILSNLNDTYFSLSFNDAILSINTKAAIYFSYDSSVGYATDLAGNLLISVVGSAINVSSPIFVYTIGSVGLNRVYSKFSQAVYNVNNRKVSFEPEDFSIIDGTGYTIEEVIPITTETMGDEIGVEDVFFILNKPIEASDFLNIKFKPVTKALTGRSDSAFMDNIHNVSDFAIGLIEPLWAFDAYSSISESGQSIRNFTGTDKLPPVDITLEAAIIVPSSPLPVSMYFDADVPDNAKVGVGNFWLPTLFPGYNRQPNIEASGLSPFQSKESLRDFLIPGGNSNMKSGNEIEFIFTVAGRYAGRLLDHDDPTSIAPWKISLQSIKQRGGVTILNNVINVSRGEKTILTLDTTEKSVFTINIFSLSGSVVKQLYKGSLSAGNYNFTWDGKNTGGRNVARGIYFIRVVGKDIDEYRKVIVAKD